MNRPHNRRVRPPVEGRVSNAGMPSARRAHVGNVPTIEQVVPGASVSIILKEDQPTGRQVQGVIQDLLTRGNHPRGIKVRLQDGRIGRVQRMADGPPALTQNNLTPTPPSANRVLRMETDARRVEAEYTSGPQPRSLADFFPQLNSESTHKSDTRSTGTAKCPICNVFEGDEIAVSRHVEEHLT